MPKNENKSLVRKVWKYQKGNQKPSIKGQTIQWPKEKDKMTNSNV